MSFAPWEGGATLFEQKDSINPAFLAAVTPQLLGAILLLVANAWAFPYGALEVIAFQSGSQIRSDHITVINCISGRMLK